MPLPHLLLPAMAVAAVLGAAGAAVVVAGDGSATPVAAPAVTVTVGQPAPAAPVTTAPSDPGGTAGQVDPTPGDQGSQDGQGSQGAQGDTITLPSLVGLPLDEASTLLDDAGLQREVDGGGLFGVLDDSGWTVCDTTPEPGAEVVADDVVVVHVDRSCA